MLKLNNIAKKSVFMIFGLCLYSILLASALYALEQTITVPAEKPQGIEVDLPKGEYVVKIEGGAIALCYPINPNYKWLIGVAVGTLTPTYGKFIAEPFERGYGTTIGNALRRVLISSIDGAAVTSIKIDGMLHEFSAVEGVVEDGAQIVMNVKKLVLRYHGKGPKKIYIDIKKQGPVKAGDIQADERGAAGVDELHSMQRKGLPGTDVMKRIAIVL